MVAALTTLAASRSFTFEVTDVDADPTLVAKYDELVPVLVHDGREICHYVLDLEAVRSILV